MGDPVVVTGKWTLTSPKGFSNSDGLLVFSVLENVTTGVAGTPAPTPEGAAAPAPGGAPAMPAGDQGTAAAPGGGRVAWMQCDAIA